VTRLRPLLRRGATLLLLPLSVVPFLLLGPQIAESHRNFDRGQKFRGLPAPPVALSAAEVGRWKPLAPFAQRRIPVIAYPATGVTRAALARQMEMLRRAGARTISIHQYVRSRRGLPAGLPPRPVLVSFDGGLLETFRGADKVLQRNGLRATMFPLTGPVDERDRDYLTWRELHAMQRSGRWDVQPGAYDGGPRLTVDPYGGQGEFYAYRRYTRSAGQETFADWQTRVSRDVFDAREAMVAHGFDAVAFSVPFGNYGQRGSNDPRIAAWVRGLLAAQFPVVFASANGGRYQVDGTTTADDLYRWLRR
jgi:hypothetical protein